MQGKLYLCATPIGNLEDITYRVLRILKEVDIIGAEDTRHSINLMNYFNIATPMTSYHEYNKIEKGSDILPETFSYLRSIFYYFGGILYIPVPNIESITIITLILFAEKKE